MIQTNVIRLFLCFAAGLVVYMYSGTTPAAFVCYDEKYYPSVYKLNETKEGFRAELGGSYIDYEAKMSKELIWERGKGWVAIKPVPCQGYCRSANIHGAKCATKIPKWDVPPEPEWGCQPGETCRGDIPTLYLGEGEPPEEIIDEEPSSCVVEDNVVWFGINFYRGEGYSGYGGLGRFDRHYNHLEVRRPKALKHVPIHKVVWDGESIWAATTSNYECLGHPPALGLVRYQWEKQLLSMYYGREDGPCGFLIHDLTVEEWNALGCYRIGFVEMGQ